MKPVSRNSLNWAFLGQPAGLDGKTGIIRTQISNVSFIMSRILHSVQLFLVLKQRPGGTWKWPIGTLLYSRNAKIRILFVVPPKFRDNCNCHQKLKTMLMQNFTETTRSMMVFF